MISYYRPVLQQTGFYNRAGECSLRGTRRVFEIKQMTFRPKRVNSCSLERQTNSGVVKETLGFCVNCLVCCLSWGNTESENCVDMIHVE